MISSTFKARSRNTIWILALVILVANSAVMEPATTSSTNKQSSSPFTQPTFDFDFSSMVNRKSAQNTMDQARSNWGTFFNEKPKAQFSE